MNMLRRCSLGLATLGMTVSPLASADIIDAGAYTTDTNLGIDYLDVGLVFGTYADFLAGIVYDGRTWELASADQIASTWSDATGLSLTTADIFSSDNDMGAAASAILHSLFDGVTTDVGQVGEAVVGDYNIAGYYNFILGGSLAVHDTPFYDSHYLNSTSGTLGAWLVSSTTVPEPGTLALLGLGLAAIGLTRRRRKT